MEQQPENQNLEKKIDEIAAKVDAVYRSSEKMRKYFLWTLIITAILIIIPLVILPFVISSFMQSLSVPAGL